MDWKSLPNTVITSEDRYAINTDGVEWPHDSFYEQNYIISNLEYAKLKLSNFKVKILNTEPIAALFDTGATNVHVYYNKYLGKCQAKLTWLRKF